MKERKVIITNITKREKFGPGKAGERAFGYVEAGLPCEGRGCTKTATKTLDFHILTGLEQIPLCDDCLPLVREEAEEELGRQGRFPRFTINGWGRP